MSNNNEVQIIETWQKDDFLLSTAPYEWLYGYKSDPFVQAQLIDRVKTYAKTVGVTAFIRLWNDFKKSQAIKNSGAIQYGNSTNFENQEIELISGEYVCDDDGVTYTDRFGVEVVVCSHPLMPIRRLVNIDNGEVKIEIAIKRYKQWQSFIVDKAQLSSAQKIVELSKYGIAVNSENSREIVKYLSRLEELNYDKLEQLNSVSRMGWVNENSFIPYVENIKFDGNVCFKRMFNAIKKSGSETEWVKTAKEARRNITVKIVLAASFASVLLKPYDVRPFFVHVWGGAGAGKTVLLMLAASVWANPQLGEYIHSLNSTAVGQEMIAGFLNNMPLILDELQVVSNKNGYDDVIYQLCEGVGRIRGHKGGGVQDMLTWSNTILTTGEQPITNAQSGTGAFLRVLDIDCKDDKLFKDPRKLVADIKHNYGHAGEMFIKLFSDKALSEAIKKRQSQILEEFQELKISDKHALIGSLLISTDEVISGLMFHDKPLAVKDLLPFLSRQDAVDKNTKAHEWLMSFIASNPQKFRGRNNFGDYTSELWGKRMYVKETDSSYICIISTIVQTKMQEAGYNYQSYISWAKRNDKIQVDNQGRTNPPIRIEGNVVRCIMLKTDGKYEEEVLDEEEK